MPPIDDHHFEPYAHRLIGAALARLGRPFLLLGASGTVLFAPALAEAMLVAGSHLRRDANGSLLCQTVEARAELATFLAACTPGTELDIVLGSHNGKPALPGLLYWFEPPVDADLPRLPPIAVLVIRERGAIDDIEQISLLYALSPAEAAVVGAIIAGRTVQEYAGERGISVHTARKQLSAAMRKTGVSRQSHLVGLLGRTPTPADA